MTNMLIRAICVALAVASAAAGADKANAVRVETFDGRAASGQLVSLSPEKLELSGKEGKAAWPLGEVGKIRFVREAEPLEAMARPDTTVVLTDGGDLLPARQLKLAQEKFTFNTPALGTVSMPVARAAKLLLGQRDLTPAAIEKRCAEMKIRRGGKDVIVLSKKAGAWLFVAGVLTGIDAEGARFDWKGQPRTVKGDLVPAIYMAATQAPPKPLATLVALDGTRLTVSALALAGDKLAYTSPALGKGQVALSALWAVEFGSESVVDLSTLKPSSVTEYGFFDRRIPHRVNLSAGGGPLRLSGRKYPTGLGLHSFCELTYDLAGAYATLVATVGIDDSVRPAGNAVLTVLGDGKPLGAPMAVLGKENPKQIRLGVAGVRKLTLRVDFGPDKLDVADHVDLVAARLIKKK